MTSPGSHVDVGPVRVLCRGVEVVIATIVRRPAGPLLRNATGSEERLQRICRGGLIPFPRSCTPYITGCEGSGRGRAPGGGSSVSRGTGLWGSGSARSCRCGAFTVGDRLRNDRFKDQRMCERSSWTCSVRPDDLTDCGAATVLELDIVADSLELRLSGMAAVFATRRCLRLPRARVQRAFVLGRSFACNASPRIPFPGWSARRSRVGVFGLRDRAQLWSAGHRPVVLALYLRGEPYHRIVCEVDDPVACAALVNRWINSGTEHLLAAQLQQAQRHTGDHARLADVVSRLWSGAAARLREPTPSGPTPRGTRFWPTWPGLRRSAAVQRETAVLSSISPMVEESS